MSFSFIVLQTLVVICVYLLYKLYLKQYWYWMKKNIPHIKPRPIVGNLGGFVFRTRPLALCIQDIYETHSSARYIGFHKLLQPALLIKDPELIKNVTIKDWQSFSQHVLVVSKTVDPLWGYSVVAMKGDELWRQMRSILSFAFTSSKLKKMFGLMKDCSKQFLTHIDKTPGTVLTVDIRETFLKYTNDVIGSTAFGINCNSFEEPKNDFYTMGKKATNFEGFQALKFFLNGFSPYLLATLKISIYSQGVRNFFYRVIRETMIKRKKYNIIRPDMIHLMMKANIHKILDNEHKMSTCDKGTGGTSNAEEQKLVINDDVMTAQALIFFIGGFDSTATVMSFTAFELACNLDVQETLRHEIDLAYEACNGEITYETLSSLKYLDMVVSEALRKWPTILVSDRAVVKSHTIESHEKGAPPITIDTDVCYAIPIYSIHRDPKYFPNPDKFDPERFSDKNKVNIKPYTYLPFGSGPRGCIGSRFALLEIKLIIAEIIHRFEIIPVEKTDFQMKLSAQGFLLRPKNSIILGLKRRFNLSSTENLEVN